MGVVRTCHLKGHFIGASLVFLIQNFLLLKKKILTKITSSDFVNCLGQKVFYFIYSMAERNTVAILRPCFLSLRSSLSKNHKIYSYHM